MKNNIKVLFFLLASAPIRLLCAQSIELNAESGQSLFLEICKDSKLLGTATGFIITKKDKNYLITNWHVVTNRNYYKKGTPLNNGGAPNCLWIFYNRSDTIGTFKPIKENLFLSNGIKKWVEFTYNGKLTDVVAMEIITRPGIQLYPVNLIKGWAPPILTPMMDVFIIGFPYGQSSYKYFPIYKKGMIASEPYLNYSDLPVFLIDANTKPGMSGSPVIFRPTEPYKAENGNIVYAAREYRQFLGVYSAQDTLSGIGLVWKADYLISQFNNLP